MFARTLPERFRTLESLWQKYLNKPDTLFQDNFHREAHNLVGACGSFGLTEVSDSARVVELLAAEFPIEVKSINEAMAELSERCSILASSVTEHSHQEALLANAHYRSGCESKRNPSSPFFGRRTQF